MRYVAFTTLFTLDDAAVTATSDLLGVRVLPNKDPHGAIADFNDALTSARRRGAMDDEDATGLFRIDLVSVYYQPVVSRLRLHDQRLATDVLPIQQWVRDC
ncbi:hypothetical protein CYMTET_11226 [Cymbomonas tetramitiformis]|uniref:Uncharacterized protein n=1 Tax=Cymbomonas tetramitiformis TaxID=36881 RepID=A0AAE0GN49_9CHLO|nr:hypothetical protein CYMTET_11226 [Cymbomonas tetramitiformis]